MINLNEEIDLLLEHSLEEEKISLMLEQPLNKEVFRKLDLLLERSEPLSSGEVRSVLNGIGMTKTMVLQKFKDYLKSQKSTPLGAAADAEVADKVKRLAQVFSDIWKDFYSTGTASFSDASEEEPEVTGTDEEPEETGTDEELTEEELEQLQKIQAAAIDLLTKRTILLGPDAYNNMSTINKVGQVIRKYFISKTALRALQEEESPAAPTTPRLRASSASSESETADLLRQLSTKVLIRPEEAAQNFDKLKQKVKVSIIDDNWRALEAPQKEKQFDITSSLIRDAAFDKLSESMVLKEDKMVEIVIDFDELKEKRLDESFLAMFGGWVEHLLKAMFGGSAPPVSIRGTQSDVRAFAKALGGEKSYIDAAKRYGLDHPTTYKNKAKLDNAVKGFEGDTGLAWPFK
jgi:hypothetical protein